MYRQSLFHLAPVKKNESIIIMKKWLNNDKHDPCTIYIFLPKI